MRRWGTRRFAIVALAAGLSLSACGTRVSQQDVVAGAGGSTVSLDPASIAALKRAAGTAFSPPATGGAGGTAAATTTVAAAPSKPVAAAPVAQPAAPVGRGRDQGGKGRARRGPGEETRHDGRGTCGSRSSRSGGGRRSLHERGRPVEAGPDRRVLRRGRADHRQRPNRDGGVGAGRQRSGRDRVPPRCALRGRRQCRPREGRGPGTGSGREQGRAGADRRIRSDRFRGDRLGGGEGQDAGDRRRRHRLLLEQQPVPVPGRRGPARRYPGLAGAQTIAAGKTNLGLLYCVEATVCTNASKVLQDEVKKTNGTADLHLGDLVDPTRLHRSVPEREERRCAGDGYGDGRRIDRAGGPLVRGHRLPPAVHHQRPGSEPAERRGPGHPAQHVVVGQLGRALDAR